MDKIFRTTLTGKELEIIEKLILKHGNVVDFNMVYQAIGKKRSNQEIRNFISKLIKKGWFMKIKKGIYIISDIASRGNIELNQLAIAHIIDPNSYISFEAALQHYHMFDQYLKIIVSVGHKRTHLKQVSNWNFKYIKVKKGLFSDFKEFNIDGQLVKIASREKAIIDFLIYRRTEYSIDLIIEKIKDYQNDLDIDKLIQISKKCPITIQRTLGVVFDILNIDSQKLYKLVQKNKNYSFMTTPSKIFNAKWRIYLPSLIQKYVQNH